MDKVWVVFEEAHRDDTFHGVYSSRRKAWYKLARLIVSNCEVKPELEVYGVGGDVILSYYDHTTNIRWVAFEEELDNLLLSDSLNS